MLNLIIVVRDTLAACVRWLDSRIAAGTGSAGPAVTLTPDGRLTIIGHVGRMLPDASREHGNCVIEAAAPLLEWAGRAHDQDDAKFRFRVMRYAADSLGDAAFATRKASQPARLSPERLLGEVITYYAAATGAPAGVPADDETEERDAHAEVAA